MTANAEALRKATTAQDALSDAKARYNELLVASRGFEGLGVTGNGGLAGIYDSSLTGVRQAGSRLSDSDVMQSGFGTTSSMSGQYKPPDNSGNWTFDTAAWQAAGGALGNFTTDASVQRFWKRTGPAPTRAPGTNAFGGSSGSQARAERTVNVNLNVGGKKASTLTGSQSDVNALLAALEAAQRNAGA